jgi:hypothetical protein
MGRMDLAADLVTGVDVVRRDKVVIVGVGRREREEFPRYDC